MEPCLKQRSLLLFFLAETLPTDGATLFSPIREDPLPTPLRGGSGEETAVKERGVMAEAEDCGDGGVVRV
jgi:hypothetical protein